MLGIAYPTISLLVVFDVTTDRRGCRQCIVQDGCQILREFFLCIPSIEKRSYVINTNFHMAVNVTLEKFQLSDLLLV